MTKISPWVAPGLLLGALVMVGYVWMVQGPVRARMEKVADRAEQLRALEESMREYRAVQAGLGRLSAVPLPDLREVLNRELPGIRVRLEEGDSLRLDGNWMQRRVRVIFDTCSLSALQGWLLRVQQGETGWRLMSLEIQAESQEGHGTGELELAGLEKLAAGEEQ